MVHCCQQLTVRWLENSCLSNYRQNTLQIWLTLSDVWKAAWSKKKLRDCLVLARRVFLSQQPSYLFANNFISVSSSLNTLKSREAPLCSHISLLFYGSSTGSDFGLDCRGAQGGSALTVGGNSFRKYQTARHTRTHTHTIHNLSFFSSTSGPKLFPQTAQVKRTALF